MASRSSQSLRLPERKTDEKISLELFQYLPLAADIFCFYRRRLIFHYGVPSVSGPLRGMLSGSDDYSHMALFTISDDLL